MLVLILSWITKEKKDDIIMHKREFRKLLNLNISTLNQFSEFLFVQPSKMGELEIPNQAKINFNFKIITDSRVQFDKRSFEYFIICGDKEYKIPYRNMLAKLKEREERK